MGLFTVLFPFIFFLLCSFSTAQLEASRRLIFKPSYFYTGYESFKQKLQELQRSRGLLAPEVDETMVRVKRKEIIGRRLLETYMDDKHVEWIDYLDYLGAVGMVVLYFSEKLGKLMFAYILELLESDPEVDFAEPDQKIFRTQSNRADPELPLYDYARRVRVSDPYLKEQWGVGLINSDGGSLDYRKELEVWDMLAWAKKHVGLRENTIAVLDTGVDYMHEDLIDQMWKNEAEANGIAGEDDDGNGYTDDVYGYNFPFDTSDVYDSNGHGTASAGIIAAAGDNGLGIVGLDWNAKIMALKMMNGDTGWLVDAIRALDYAIQKGAILTNNGWGDMVNFSPALEWATDRCSKKNILFVTGAGNLGRDIDAKPHPFLSLMKDNVISAAALYNDTASLKLDDSSNFGRKTVHLAAPGSNVFVFQPDRQTKKATGTSMASAHVSGVASVAWSLLPNASFEEIKRLVLDNVIPAGALHKLVITGGFLNMYGVVKEAFERRTRPSTIK